MDSSIEQINKSTFVIHFEGRIIPATNELVANHILDRCKKGQKGWQTWSQEYYQQVKTANRS